MSSIDALPTRKSVLAPLRLFVWRHPEWGAVALAALAWGVLLVHGWQHVSHGPDHRMSFGEELRSWLWMVAAMMLPFTVHSIRQAAAGSLWVRRQRAIAEFLLGYFAPWALAGIAAATLRQAAWTHTYVAAALGFAFAALWLKTPLYARGLAECHRSWPLAPSGWKADRDCLRFGAAIGSACVLSCWPWMIACAFAGHGLVAMLGSVAVTAAERWSYWPRPGRVLLGTLALASSYAVAACVPLQAREQDGMTLVAETREPLMLAGLTHVDLELRVPEHSDSMYVLLNIEQMTSETLPPPYLVYLNLPPHDDPARHPDLSAGLLSLYGLVSASRPSEGRVPGLSEQLEVTELYSRLAAAPGWNPRKLRVSFVPAQPIEVDASVVRVGRIRLYFTPAPRGER